MDDPDLDPEPRDVDRRIEELLEAHSKAHERCLIRTSARLAGELRRLAKAERRLPAYLRAQHILTITADDLLDPDAGREAAVELIALLESEDRARSIQPDLVEAQYAYAISRMSSCAYDNLATATARTHGFNSEGVHGGISEGIEICRRTGNLECITCFREYATDVYRASDDLEMAMEHARHVATHGNSSPNFDRRYAGASSEADLLLLAGDLESAEAAAGRALALVPTYHSPFRAELKTRLTLRKIRLLKGDVSPSPNSPDEAEAGPPEGEFPWLDLQRGFLLALEDTILGRHDAAIARLSDWDRTLSRRNCLEHWFDARLRLIAAHRLAGRDDQAKALATPLKAKAGDARDWLTLRRLARLLDPDEPVSPIASAAPMSSGPYAAQVAGGVGDILAAATAPESAPPSAGQATATGGPPKPAGPPGETPLASFLDGLAPRFRAASEDPAGRAAILDEVLAHRAATVSHPLDACRLIHLAHVLGVDPSRVAEAWGWADEFANRFDREATVLSLVADFGDTLHTLAERAGGPEPATDGGGASGITAIDPDRLVSLFRRSLDLDPENVGNFARAGAYYLSTGNLGEAERCLARGFRLDRSSAFFALRLAEIYNRTDRNRDGLSALDMSLRHGCDEPGVAWQAAMTAHNLGQFEVMLTYLERFEALDPGRPWVHYYRAIGHLELGRAEEALPALAEEERRQPECTCAVAALRAAAESALGQLDRFREQLAKVLGERLVAIDYLTKNGLLHLFTRLRKAAKAVPEDDPLRLALEDRLLATGLAPNELFDEARRSGPVAEGIGFYVCTLAQPLGDGWADSPGCLAGEAAWTRYTTTWGVLAHDEDEAARVALSWQARCGVAEPATVEGVTLQEEGFKDHPGAVWQGFREGEGPP